MKIEIKKSQGELKQEYWVFNFIVDWHSTQIRLDYYAIQYKDNPRQRNWRCNEHWETMDSRRNTIAEPPLPPDVIGLVKQEIIKEINNLNHIIVYHSTNLTLQGRLKGATKMNDKLILQKEMDGSWLIQRLQKPCGFDNPFSFGGGLKNGGLSDEAMGLLRGIFSFDYMGSAEFEFGAVPQALRFLGEQAIRHNLIAATLILDTKGNEKVYYIAPREYAPEVVNRIKQLRKDPYAFRLKEHCGLNEYFEKQSEYAKRNVGWLEIDNGYFFFVDRDMYEKTCKLFGIELINK